MGLVKGSFLVQAESNPVLHRCNVATARFPIDVTFPGEAEPDDVDRWIADHAMPFHLRA